MLWDNPDPWAEKARGRRRRRRNSGERGSFRRGTSSDVPDQEIVMRQAWLVIGVVLGASVTLAHAQGRGAGPSKTPSALRAVAAETTAAKVKDPNWKAPRTAWGHPDLEGTWTSDDMRGVPTSRPPAQADRESLTPEEFARRAGGDEASRDRAVNQETFLRNEFGVRTFGYTSFVVEPKDGRMPALTAAGQAKQK